MARSLFFSPYRMVRERDGMAWVESLFQRETLPALEASMGFAHQKQLTIMNNIANVETPYYQRQTVPEGEFLTSLERAIEQRKRHHPDRFEMHDTPNIRYRENHYPEAQRDPGRAWGPMRHDENNVVIEKEMADLAKNTLRIQVAQRLFKKKLTMMRSSLRDRVA